MMNIMSLLNAPPVGRAWQGSWARLWLRPDVFSAQEFIVGVAAIDDNGLFDFRVITGADKLACVYGANHRFMFERMLADLRACLLRARVNRAPITDEYLPEIFRFEVVGSLRTQLPSEALERMLRDGTIPMEEFEVGQKKKRFESRNAESVVKDVLDRVRLHIPFGGDNFIRDDYIGDESHRVGVNLVKAKAAGMVASGWYSSGNRIQLEFLLGASKLEAYVAATERDIEKSALFFVRPTNEYGLPKLIWQDVEKRLDTLQWQLQQKKVKVISHANVDVLAQEVVTWADAVN